MRNGITILAFVLLCSLSASADPPKDKGTPPGLAKKGGVPPGQADKGMVPGIAKKNELPPGLAKKFGQTAAAPVYVAFDPQHEDRAWVLRNGRWALQQGFDDSLRQEVHQLLGTPLPPAPVSPPVPLPPMNVRLRVMVFGS
jgi:hypothetical protein